MVAEPKALALIAALYLVRHAAWAMAARLLSSPSTSAAILTALLLLLMSCLKLLLPGFAVLIVEPFPDLLRRVGAFLAGQRPAGFRCLTCLVPPIGLLDHAAKRIHGPARLGTTAIRCGTAKTVGLALGVKPRADLLPLFMFGVSRFHQSDRGFGWIERYAFMPGIMQACGPDGPILLGGHAGVAGELRGYAICGALQGLRPMLLADAHSFRDLLAGKRGVFLALRVPEIEALLKLRLLQLLPYRILLNAGLSHMQRAYLGVEFLLFGFQRFSGPVALIAIVDRADGRPLFGVLFPDLFESLLAHALCWSSSTFCA